jgi:predicted amidohydrolase
MNTPFVIVGLQLDLAPKDNLSLICDAVRAAVKEQSPVDMVLISELATVGVGTASAEPLPSKTEGVYCALAKELGIWLLPGSLYSSSDDGIFNTVSVINPTGDVVTRYHKIYPFYPYEVGVAQGVELGLFDVPGVGRFGIANCYDIWFPELTRALTIEGATIILNPVFTNTNDRDIEVAIVRATAAQQQCYVVSVNGAAPLARGCSLAVDPHGTVTHQLTDAAGVMRVEIDVKEVARSRERGVRDLGQTLKSYRDSDLSLAHYKTGHTGTVLTSLGALKKPQE